METLATGFGKSPFSIQPGDRLRSANLVKIKKAKVSSVEWLSATGLVKIITDEGSHLFQPGQSVAFPRRVDGSTKIHQAAALVLSEVMIGDVIPPESGWSGSESFREGKLITYIQPSARFKGFIVSYRPCDGSKGGKLYLPINNAVFNSDSMIYMEGQSLDVPKMRVTEPKNASGIYVNLETEDQARFRIVGFRGRPPQDVPVLKAPSHLFEWDPWQLLSGSRHPEDPRG